jgi:hypothetical protein
MGLQFGFVIFWQKDLGIKAAHKMLAKLTPEAGCNFRCIRGAPPAASRRPGAGWSGPSCSPTDQPRE